LGAVVHARQQHRRPQAELRKKFLVSSKRRSMLRRFSFLLPALSPVAFQCVSRRAKADQLDIGRPKGLTDSQTSADEIFTSSFATGCSSTLSRRERQYAIEERQYLRSYALSHLAAMIAFILLKT